MTESESLLQCNYLRAHCEQTGQHHVTKTLYLKSENYKAKPCRHFCSKFLNCLFCNNSTTKLETEKTMASPYRMYAASKSDEHL